VNMFHWATRTDRTKRLLVSGVPHILRPLRGPNFTGKQNPGETKGEPTWEGGLQRGKISDLRADGCVAGGQRAARGPPRKGPVGQQGVKGSYGRQIRRKWKFDRFETNPTQSLLDGVYPPPAQAVQSKKKKKKLMPQSRQGQNRGIGPTGGREGRHPRVCLSASGSGRKTQAFHRLGLGALHGGCCWGGVFKKDLVVPGGGNPNPGTARNGFRPTAMGETSRAGEAGDFNLGPPHPGRGGTGVQGGGGGGTRWPGMGGAPTVLVFSRGHPARTRAGWGLAKGPRRARRGPAEAGRGELIGAPTIRRFEEGVGRENQVLGTQRVPGPKAVAKSGPLKVGPPTTAHKKRAPPTQNRVSAEAPQRRGKAVGVPKRFRTPGPKTWTAPAGGRGPRSEEACRPIGGQSPRAGGRRSNPRSAGPAQSKGTGGGRARFFAPTPWFEAGRRRPPASRRGWGRVFNPRADFARSKTKTWPPATNLATNRGGAGRAAGRDGRAQRGLPRSVALGGVGKFVGPGPDPPKGHRGDRPARVGGPIKSAVGPGGTPPQSDPRGRSKTKSIGRKKNITPFRSSGGCGG